MVNTNGDGYEGFQRVASNDKLCINWSEAKDNNELPENFCRNPGG